MTDLLSGAKLDAAQSRVDGALSVTGLDATVLIRRDAFGIPHIHAQTEHDAWFGQGFASAQDRLWQMEYDRRRACGRWAELAGPAAVAGDVLARRLQLARSARADVDGMSPATRDLFTAYAAGVNAFLRSGQPLPVEYELAGTSPEFWEPWHSVVSFKIRHVLMGTWQLKLTQAWLLARIGPDAYARLDGRPPVASVTILPPGGATTRLVDQGVDEIRASAKHLGFLAEAEAGSNSWAVHGSRTTTGRPVLCNDSHRALDVPNVYWQVHVACPELDVIGATFPGIPGFPHFGHNGHVGWNITHGSADYQDLYVERFDRSDPWRYATPRGWEAAERQSETIHVRGERPVQLETWRTRHGPVVHGDPRSGYALSLRYTATDAPCRGFEVFRPMLQARTVEEIQDAQREWVDPVNNLVAADTAGNIGYLLRGVLPIRASAAHRQFPAPGWTDEHEWTGTVPFERMPRSINPVEGFIATANQKIVDGDDPYIAHAFAVPSRAERVVELLTTKSRYTPDELMSMQGDTTSRPAQAWTRLLGRVGPFRGDAESSRLRLVAWDGNLTPDSDAALLYSCFRRVIARALFEPVVGRDVWISLASGDQPSANAMISRWLANVVWRLDETHVVPDGRPWDVILPEALASSWRAASALCGSDSTTWRWDRCHTTAAEHTLSRAFPDKAGSLDPPRVPIGGDGDTIQAASYGFAEDLHFNVSGLSVYRQAIDLSDVEHATSVVPAGSSGLPGTPHFSDQLERWRTHHRVPMHYTEGDVRAAAEHTLTLQPSSRTDPEA